MMMDEALAEIKKNMEKAADKEKLIENQMRLLR
jgi:hypothetical protein